MGTDDRFGRRIVAFADTLGWTTATMDETKYDLQLDILKSLAKHARSFSPETKDMLKTTRGIDPLTIQEHAGIEFSFFSDSFAISAPTSSGQRTFGILAWVCDKLLHKGFLVRGGIALGKLYHRDRIICGPALIEAVELEKAASYPRCLCSRDVVKFLDDEPYKEEVILQDCCDESVANTACGSLYNRDALLKIVASELHESKKEERKWRYVQTMLPKLFAAKSITY